MEIATERDEPVCGGTADYMDRVIEAVYATIGETPPDRRFVRFEWLELDEDDPVIGGAFTRWVDDGVLIRSDVALVEEHELVHAVQREAWPRSNDFLVEGLAVLFDAKRLWRDAYPWPESASLDELLGAPNVVFADYDLAWFVVSQIVLDHGFEGLRDFWHAVPRGSSATEVRAAYEALFGRSIDALVEPYQVGEPGTPGSYEMERRACDFSLCPAPSVTEWEGEQWSAAGPIGCEDDPNAIGPDRRRLFEWGEVWRDYTMPAEPAFYRTEYTAKRGYGYNNCELHCEWLATGMTDSFEGPFTFETFEEWEGPTRFEVRAALSDLPADAPGSVTVVQVPPP